MSNLSVKPPKETFTTREFAELVNREPRTIYLWIQQGKIKPERDFRNRYFFTRKHYEAVMGIPLADGSEQ